MRFALVNPRWSFEGSTYFGCPEPHFPLELLSAREMLRATGQEVLLIDAWMENLSVEEVATRLHTFDEDFLVIPTAPSYLFWRCPQPELRVPSPLACCTQSRVLQSCHWSSWLGNSAGHSG